MRTYRTQKFPNAIQQWLMDYFDRDKTCIRDCANSGAANGSCGLIYTRDIHSFYTEHSADVWESLEDFGQEIGESIGELMSNIFLTQERRGTPIISQDDLEATICWQALEYESQRILDLDLIPSENYATDDDDEDEE